MSKVTKGYALAALLQQLQQWHEDNDKIYFGALATHPETDDCTFGDLIAPAVQEFATRDYYQGAGPRVPVWVCDNCHRKNIGAKCKQCGRAHTDFGAPAAQGAPIKGTIGEPVLVNIAKRVLGLEDQPNGINPERVDGSYGDEGRDE